MASTSFTFSLESFDSFARKVSSALARHMTSVLDDSIVGIRNGIQDVVVSAVRESPTFASLLTGEMWHVMGLSNPSQTLDDILQVIGDSINVHSKGCKASSGKISGGMTVSVLKADYSELLGHPSSRFLSENGFNVDWLEWLLTTGGETVLADYFYLGKQTDSSRTGTGIMIKSRKGFRVPSEFAGTHNDNWITRALDTTEAPIAKVIQTELERHI